MRPEHVKLFLEAARQFQCWIIVRPSNCDSDKYIHSTNCEAKPLGCKAKTANNRKHRFAGLVVDPYMVKDAFRSESVHRARIEWDKFQSKLSDQGSGYSVVQEGNMKGCVTRGGRFLHSDYDLLAVIPLDDHKRPRPTDPRSKPQKVKNEDGDSHYLSQLVNDVMTFFNKDLDRPLVRHGADFDDMEEYRPGEELCDWFGPEGADKKHYFAPPNPSVH